MVSIELLIVFGLLGIFIYLSKDSSKSSKKEKKEDSSFFWIYLILFLILVIVCVIMGAVYSDNIMWFLSKIPLVNRYFTYEQAIPMSGGHPVGIVPEGPQVPAPVVPQPDFVEFDDGISVVSE